MEILGWAIFELQALNKKDVFKNIVIALFFTENWYYILLLEIINFFFVCRLFFFLNAFFSL